MQWLHQLPCMMERSKVDSFQQFFVPPKMTVHDAFHTSGTTSLYSFPCTKYTWMGIRQLSIYNEVRLQEFLCWYRSWTFEFPLWIDLRIDLMGDGNTPALNGNHYRRRNRQWASSLRSIRGFKISIRRLGVCQRACNLTQAKWLQDITDDL